MKTKKTWIVILNIILVLSGLIWILTNVGPDEEYQIAQANRLLQGDRLFVHMWEPHQTSVFFCAFWMFLYKLLFHTYDGVVLFLQALGILCRAGVAFCLYRVLRKEAGKEISFGCAVLFFMISPKDFAIPEYSNLQVWFAAFCFLFLVMYFRNFRVRYLVFAAVMLCLEVIVYPSCIIVAIPVIIILIRYAKEKTKAVLCFLLPCILIGSAVIAYLLVTHGIGGMTEFYHNMISLEPSHNVGFVPKTLNYLKDFGIILGILLAVLAISTLIGGIVFAVRKVRKKEADIRIVKEVTVIVSSAILLIGFLLNILSVDNRCAYGILFFYMLGLGFSCRKSLSEDQKRIYYAGTLISITGFAATLIFTNLPFIVSTAYLVLAVSLSVLPVSLHAKNSKAFFQNGVLICGLLFVGLLFFRCVYIRTPMTGRGQICSTFKEDMSLVHAGPAKGIITNDEGARKQQISVEEFKAYVPEGSQIWIVDGLVDDLGYLYGDYGVATPSSIPDPKYLPALENYWKMYPDKYPDVVVVGAYEGQINYDVASNAWLMNWLENEYRPSRSVDGVFWKYYYR